MRYDDASQAGHEATGLIAHPDVEALAPGSFGPANGNAISGAGTTSGQAGVDQVGAGPAAIVEVQGAGGQTVHANGAFQASGQYGLLSMNPDGDFSYVRNPGTPDGVRDVFNYTLADAAGATSSTTLTIDIGQIAAAAAAQGVVTLPAGVEMSDIHVNGRDLVINMPDGTQMVIPGGAVFVPQLVIGDVEVPPTNLAALLIDSEPQPAAGPSQSSGGNFANPVPPLDPGVPLGDLIPPTELTYTPPEFHEVNQFENTKPTVIIETPDNPAGAIDASESVNEKGLATRNGGEPAGSGEVADGNSSNNSDGSETSTGTIVFTAQDGLNSVTIDGADGVSNPVTITAASVGTTIQGQYGVLTITGVNLATGEITYSYTLSDNTSGDNTADHFTVVVTDRDGDTATGTLTVNIIDDVPTARDDTDSLDQNNHATGNVMTGVGTTSGAVGADTVGADNAHLTGVSGHDGSDTTFDGSGNLVVHGTFGTLTIDANGNYTYVLDDGSHGGGTEVFNYTLTDGDGDTSQATLTINIPVQNEPPTANNSSVNVSEEGLQNGIPDGTGSPDTTDSAQNSGNIGAVDPDGDPMTITLSAPGPDGQFTSGGADVNWFVSADGHTLIGYTGSDHDANHVIEITIDNTGHYDVNLIAPFDDPDPTSEDSIDFQVPVNVSDGQENIGVHITVTVEDDSPTLSEGRAPLGTVYEDGLPGGNPDGGSQPTELTINSASLAALVNSGADTPLTISLNADIDGTATGMTENGVSIVWNVIDATHVEAVLANDASHQVFTVTDNGDGTFTFTLLDNIDNNPLAAGDSDVDTLDLGGLFVATDADGDHVTLTSGVSIDIQNDVPTLGEGSYNVGTVYEDSLPGGNPDGGSQPTTVTINASSLAALVNEGADNPVTIGFNADIDGADTGMTEDGISIVWNVIDATHVEAVLSNDPSHQVFTVTDNGDGTFTFTLVDNIDNSPLAAGDSDVDTLDLGGLFVATDTDGDSVTLDSGVTIDIQNDVPTLGEGTYNVGTVYEDGLSGGNQENISQVTTATINASSLAALVSDGADNPVTIGFNADIDGADTGMTENGVSIVWNVIDATHVEAVLSNDASHQVFTVTDNGDGTFTFTLLDNIDNNPLGAGDSDVDALSLDGLFAATDTDGDTVVIDSGVSIDIQNDVPTVANVQGASSITFDETSVGDINGWPASSVTSAAAMITATTSVGADTPGTTAYGVALAGGVNSLASGLQTAQGDHAITLVQIDSDTIQGQYQDGGTQVAFTIDMGADGKVTYTQNVPLEHSDDGNTPIAYNDTNTPINFDGLIFATIAVTDSDGDTTTGSTNIGDQITVFDDGPTAVNPDSIVTTDEVQGPITASLDLPDNDVIDNFGADGPGTITFANVTDGMDSGLTSGGAEIDYFVTNDGQTIEARVGGAGGELVFTVDIDQANSQYIYNQYDTIDNGSGISFSDLSGGVAGNPPFKLITEPGESTELLATPINGTSINSDQDDMGVDSQFIDTTTGADQGVRLDFGNFTYHTNGGGTADDQFSMDSHSSVNGFRFTIDQVSNGTTADVHLKAIDADEDGGVNESTTNPAGDVVAPITEVIIWNGTTLVADFTGSGTINGYTATFSGGEVTIDDLPAGYSIQTFTADPGYDRIEITNPGDNSSGDTDGKFSISEFTIETSNTGEPINLSFDLQVTDSDGDYTTVAGGINIELDPSGSQSAAAVNTLMATNSLSTQSLDTTSLVSSNDNHGQEQRALQAGFTAALAGAVAAVGLEGAQHGLPQHGGGQESDRGPDFAAVHTQDAGSVSASAGAAGPRGGHDLAPSSHDDADRVAEHSGPAEAAEAKGAELDHGAARIVTELLQGTAGSAHGGTAGGDSAHIAAQGVIMPSAQQLAAASALAPQASVAGNPAQHNEVVAKALADALHGGGGDGHNIDALVEAATGSKGSGPNSGINALASHGMNTVSNGHTEDFAGFSFGHGGHMMDAMIVHQDAAPAHG